MSIRLDHVSYIYNQGTSMETYTLKDISLTIEKGEFVAMIGHTGSGKSTLIQQLNGLEKPTQGQVCFENRNIWEKQYNRRQLRCSVGVVFQYPEHQLFEETVLKDVCFGPLNQKLSLDEAEQKAIQALQLVGVPEELYQVSPFELSGGQKRRVAIAGVLAMEPDFLVLDEPTAGLDPKGRTQILEMLKELHQNKKLGIVLVSHSMEDVAKYAERIVVLHRGEIVYDASPQEVFSHHEELEQIGLEAPKVLYIMQQLKNNGWDVTEDLMDVESAKNDILKCFENLKRGEENG